MAGAGHGIGHGVGGAQQFAGAGQFRITIGSTGHGTAPEFAIILVAAGVGQDHRQGDLAIAEIIAGILAHGFGVRHIIDGVVHQLEGDAEIAAIAGQCLLALFITLGNHAGNLTGGGEQRGRLGTDDVEVTIFGGGHIARGGELGHLAFRNHG